MGIENDSHTLVLLRGNNLENIGKANKNIIFSREYGTIDYANDAEFGTVFSFNGRTSIATEYSGYVVLSDSWTVDYWVKISNLTKSCFWKIGERYTKTLIGQFAEITPAQNEDGKLNTANADGRFTIKVSTPSALSVGKWYHSAISYSKDNSKLYFFLNGILYATLIGNYALPTTEGYKLRIGGSGGQTNEYWLQGYIANFRVSDVCRWTENFTPSKEIDFTNTGLFEQNTPIDLEDYTAVTAITVDGTQPTGTQRGFAFKVDDVYNKVNTDGTLTPLPSQAITIDSVLTEGNTADELNALTDVPSIVGKLVYPVIALQADTDAEEMPTAKVSFTASRTDEVKSREYLSDMVKINGRILKQITKDATSGATITIALYDGTDWSDYISLPDAVGLSAQSVRLKAICTVENVGDVVEVKEVKLTYGVE